MPSVGNSVTGAVEASHAHVALTLHCMLGVKVDFQHARTIPAEWYEDAGLEQDEAEEDLEFVCEK